MNVSKMITIGIGFSLIFFLISCKSETIDKNFLQNSEHTNYLDEIDLVERPSLRWKIKTDGAIVSSPVVHNGIVYVGSEDGKLYAADAKTGDVLWRSITDGAINSTPAISQGKLFFLSKDGYLHALELEKGELLWKFKTGGEAKFLVKDYYTGEFQPDFWDFYLSSPIVKGDRVYFGSSDSNLYALNIESGELIWKYKTKASIHSSPVYYNNLIIVGSWDSNVYAIDAMSGKLSWSFETGKDFEQYIWHGIQASPSVDDGIVFIGSRDGKVYALNAVDGKVKWVNDNFERSWMPSSIAIDKNFIYTGSSDAFAVYCLDKITGEIKYKTDTKSYTFSSPLITRDMAYIGVANGHMYGIDKVSGKINWEFKTEGYKKDTIKLFLNDGNLNLGRLKELTQNIKNMPSLSKIYEQGFKNSGAILTTPTLDNGVLYYGSNNGYLYAISDTNFSN